MIKYLFYIDNKSKLVCEKHENGKTIKLYKNRANKELRNLSIKKFDNAFKSFNGTYTNLVFDGLDTEVNFQNIEKLCKNQIVKESLSLMNKSLKRQEKRKKLTALKERLLSLVNYDSKKYKMKERIDYYFKSNNSKEDKLKRLQRSFKIRRTRAAFYGVIASTAFSFSPVSAYADAPTKNVTVSSVEDSLANKVIEAYEKSYYEQLKREQEFKLQNINSFNDEVFYEDETNLYEDLATDISYYEVNGSNEIIDYLQETISTENVIENDDDIISYEDQVYEENADIQNEDSQVWDGSVLTARMGVNHNAPNNMTEKYYDADVISSSGMDKCVDIMRNMGFDEANYPYYIREDGVRMLGGYVMVAANTDIYPKGTVLETSLGTGIVCDCCVASYDDPSLIDIATNWSKGLELTRTR